MTRSDDTILEFFADNELAFTPRLLEHNLRTRTNHALSHRTIVRRLKQLREYGYVRKEDETTGIYSITDKGRKYLAGELDREDVEE